MQVIMTTKLTIAKAVKYVYNYFSDALRTDNRAMGLCNSQSNK